MAPSGAWVVDGVDVQVDRPVEKDLPPPPPPPFPSPPVCAPPPRIPAPAAMNPLTENVDGTEVPTKNSLPEASTKKPGAHDMEIPEPKNPPIRVPAKSMPGNEPPSKRKSDGATANPEKHAKTEAALEQEKQGVKLFLAGGLPSSGKRGGEPVEVKDDEMEDVPLEELSPTVTPENTEKRGKGSGPLKGGSWKENDEVKGNGGNWQGDPNTGAGGSASKAESWDEGHYHWQQKEWEEWKESTPVAQQSMFFQQAPPLVSREGWYPGEDGFYQWSTVSWTPVPPPKPVVPFRRVSEAWLCLVHVGVTHAHAHVYMSVSCTVPHALALDPNLYVHHSMFTMHVNA